MSWLADMNNTAAVDDNLPSPAPWTLTHTIPNASSVGINGPEFMIGVLNNSAGVNIADASLIAKAPELLAMLKAVNHALYVVGKPSAVRAAMAGSKDLIHKAEGKS